MGAVMMQMLDAKQCGGSQQRCQAVACCLSPLMVSLRSMSLFWGSSESSTMQRILGLSNVNLQTAEHIVMSNRKCSDISVKASRLTPETAS